MNEQIQTISGPGRHFMERAMGIEQIQLAKTKALLPAFQFNWSQMESSSDKRPPQLPMSHFSEPKGLEKIRTQDPGTKRRSQGASQRGISATPD
jgi:hypothetical protein